MRRATPFVLILVSAACGDDAQEDTTGDLTTTDDSDSGPGTTPSSTSTASSSETESGGTTMEETTDGPTGTTAGETEGTTMIDTTSDSSAEGTTMMETEGGVAGAWADCFALSNTCLAGESCVVATDPDGMQGSFCSTGSCSDASDCAAPPATGNPTVTCEDVGTDDIAECFLSCAGGEVCPDGMGCWNALACVWPESDWLCPLSLYDQTGLAAQCDCGCGLTDPDCSDMTVASCEVCNNSGSCSAEACPGSIDALDNSLCAP